MDFIPVHDEVTARFFRQFFGVDARLSDIDFAGRSLTENFIELARLKKVPDDKVRECIPKMLGHYESFFAGSIPQDGSPYILPGVAALLEALSRTDAIVALYTGDSPGIVREVFRVTGLGRYFRFAVCGTDAPTRADMVKLAIEKAEALAGREFRGKDIVIIGDSVRDIDAGKPFDALTIAVVTGFHPERTLREHGPDYVFPDLSDHARVLEAIGIGARSRTIERGVS